MKKHILLFGNYGGQNWGDEAICQALVASLIKSGFRIDVVSSDPAFTSAHYNVNAIPRPPGGLRSLFSIRRSISFFKALRKADIVIFGGGGLFQDKEKFAVLLWWYYVSLTKLFGKKAIFVANSVGPLSTPFVRLLSRSAFSKARFISVRDHDSQILLQKLGIVPKRIVSTSDAVFLLKKTVAKTKRQGTLIMIRGDQPIILDRIKKLIKDNSFPRYVEAVAMDEMDKNIIQEIGVPIFLPESISELRKKISTSSLVLSSRLHGCLLSILEETPFIAFSSAPKVSSFLSERDLGDVIFPENFSHKKIIQKINEIIGNKRYTSKLKRIRTQEKKIAENVLPIFLQ